jgi:hypothetical protein
MSFFVGRALTVGSLLCFATLACGNSEGKKAQPAGSGGNGGMAGLAGAGGATGGSGGAPMLPPGISSMPKTIPCGGDCSSAALGLGTVSVYIDPCCTGEDEDVCGIDTSFLMSGGEACAPRDQPGEVDANCPSPPASTIPVMGAMVALDRMPGCCRENGVCGVMVNRVTIGGGLIPLANLDLGCVDAEAFFPGDDPVPCGDMGEGGASSGGASSGGASSGGASSGGASSGGASSGGAGTGGTGGAGTGGASVGGEGGEAGAAGAS